jgi:protein-tyrosine-phosphatase
MTRKILFLCPHNAAKSVIAAAYFNQSAQQLGLPFQADSAGTEPSEAVSPVVAAMLADEGIDVAQVVPRRVMSDELQTAEHIVSMGCTSEELGVAPDQIEFWLDVPPVSEQPQQAREVIRAHVEQFIRELRVQS